MPPPDHNRTADKIGMLGAVDIEITYAEKVVVVGSPGRTDAFFKDRHHEGLQKGGIEALARLLAHIPRGR